MLQTKLWEKDGQNLCKKMLLTLILNKSSEQKLWTKNFGTKFKSCEQEF